MSESINIKVDKKLEMQPLYTVYRVRSKEIEDFICNVLESSGVTRNAFFRGCKVCPSIMSMSNNSNELIVTLLFKYEGSRSPSTRFVTKNIADVIAQNSSIQSYHITESFLKALEGKFLRAGTKVSEVNSKELALNHVVLYMDYPTVLSTILGTNIEDTALLKIIPVNSGKDREMWDIEIGILTTSASMYSTSDGDIDASDISASQL